MQLSYPEMNSNHLIRNWPRQTSEKAIADAMRNDLRATTNLNEDQIINRVATSVFDSFMINPNIYTTHDVPFAILASYGYDNRFLIPEYNAYRVRGEQLLRHIWNYLASIVPFTLPPEMNFDYYRARFRGDVENWARYADRPERSILYWLSYDYDSAARARMTPLPLQERAYNYLARQDEVKLNQVMREIDPYFVPVNTGNHEWRLWQENIHGVDSGPGRPRVR